MANCSQLSHNESSLSNCTRDALPQWGIITTVILLIKVTAAVLNFTVLFLFCKHEVVRTAFNFYIAKLCMANFGHSTALYAVELVDQWLVGSPPPLALCVTHRYLNYISGGLLGNAHLLIALNRLWAVSFPISYRRYHRAGSTLSPFMVCLGMWIYVHAWVLPGISIDASVPQTAFSCSVIVSGLYAWKLSTQMVIYTMPILITLFAYPYILSKMLVRRRAIGQSAVATQRISKRRERDKDFDESAHVGTQGKDVMGPISCRRGRPVTRDGKLLTLSFLTLIATVFLLPAQFYYLFRSLDISVPGMTQMNIIVRTLYSVPPVCDPLLFLLSIKQLRNALMSCCRPARHSEHFPGSGLPNTDH